MISFWHISAVCCIPTLNVDARLREQQIYREAAESKAKAKAKLPGKAAKAHGRWEKTDERAQTPVEAAAHAEAA